MKEIHLQAGGDTEICESKDHLEFIYLDHIKSVSDFGEKFKCHLQNTNFHPHSILHSNSDSYRS